MLQIRYHPEFCSESTLLLAGSRSDIECLRTIISNWGGEQIDLIQQLGGAKNIRPFAVEDLQLKRCGRGGKLHWEGERGVWTVSPSNHRDIVETLNRLLRDKEPSHEYLPGTGGHRIMISKAEGPLTAKGQYVDAIALSEAGVAFTPESVEIIRHHVKSYEQRKLVPTLSVTHDRNDRYFVALGGNTLIHPKAFTDHVKDVSFYWYTPWLDRIRPNYIVDLDTHTKSFLIPHSEETRQRT